MVNSRRNSILSAIVTDYVATREPVGSKALVERYNLGVSSATVRNDMAALEEAGYIYQPHTSAGRVPTDKGYRAFVDQIATLKPLSDPERRGIEQFLADAVELDDVVHRTVHLLAQLTGQVAIVQYPSLQNAELRHVELVPLSENHVLTIVITASGRVEQKPVVLENDTTDTDIRALTIAINEQLAGKIPSEINAARSELCAAVPALAPFLDAIETMLLRPTEDKIVMAGTANLARAGIDFENTIGPVLDVLEEQVTLLRLFAEAKNEALAVSIGAENKHDGLSEASVVAGLYTYNEGMSSHLGIVGPTRMNYPKTMRSVNAVARYLTRFLAKG